MRNFTKAFLCFLSLLLFLTGCRDKEFEEHYGRPDWLPSPIYQQLESRGNFTNFLACVDKADYKRTLSSAGYFTVFAPNDDAFASFFTEQGISGADGINVEMARKIVTYALVYNAFEKERLTDYQSNIGWVPLNAFKRRTAYYLGVQNQTVSTDYPDKSLAGKTIKVTGANRNGGYVFGDNNNKYIPYFIAEYMESKGLSASDYGYFYPESTYSGFNVADARVVNADILAENGVIHEMDRVVLPLQSLEEYIGDKAEYSVFKGLLEKFRVNYTTLPEVTERYRILTGSSDPVYVKFYSGVLGISPNNENFLKATDNDGQSDGWSMFVPTNEALNDYINNVLLEHYASLEAMPPGIVSDFINAHMWQTTVWPSKFGNTLNFLGEEARFDPVADVVDKKVLSNGFFYGTNKVQEADVFRSVFGRAYLNPQYSLMTRFLQRELQSTITSPFVKFTLFLVPDDVLISAGYSTNSSTGEWTYLGSTNLAIERWTRLINQHVLITQNDELDDLSGKGIVETYGGEYIRYDNNTVFSAGNLDNGAVVNLQNRTPKDNPELAHNGLVYYLNGDMLRFPEKSLGLYIREHGDQAGEPYQRFYDYLRNSSIFNSSTGDILGVGAGVFHTVFIPSNAAIAQAVVDGELPASITPSAQADKDKVVNFILYHILPKFTIVGNGKEEGSFESLYKTLNGDATVLTISNKPQLTEFTVTDMSGRTAAIINSAGSNVLANRAVIHEIDNYLKNH